MSSKKASGGRDAPPRWQHRAIISSLERASHDLNARIERVLRQEGDAQRLRELRASPWITHDLGAKRMARESLETGTPRVQNPASTDHDGAIRDRMAFSLARSDSHDQAFAPRVL